MTITPSVPGTINVPSLTGDEVVRIDKGSGAGQTTTQAIANLGGGGGGHTGATGATGSTGGTGATGTGGGGGLALLSSGTITSPVAYFDVALPAGYIQFKLNVSGVQYSFRDTMGIGVSYDGGATFINDTSHSDSYFEQGMFSAGTDPVTALHNVNALMDINQGSQVVGANPPYDTVYDIFPGSVTETFRLMYMSSCWSNVVGSFVEFGTQGLNPNATVPPTAGRVNLMRLLPFGNGDIPPTSGETITSGSWTLFGIPTPA